MTFEKERQMSGTNRFDEWIEWFSCNRALVEITSAVAAGGCLSVTGFTLLRGSILGRVDPPEFSDIVSLLLIAIIPYLVAALITHWLYITPLRSLVPSWVMIALLGSFFIVVSAGVLSFYPKQLRRRIRRQSLQH